MVRRFEQKAKARSSSLYSYISLCTSLTNVLDPLRQTSTLHLAAYLNSGTSFASKSPRGVRSGCNAVDGTVLRRSAATEATWVAGIYEVCSLPSAVAGWRILLITDVRSIEESVSFSQSQRNSLNITPTRKPTEPLQKIRANGVSPDIRLRRCRSLTRDISVILALREQRIDGRLARAGKVRHARCRQVGLRALVLFVIATYAALL